MTIDFVLWVGLGTLATVFLWSMMRRRQLALIGLLKSYVERQAQWQRRRAKADAIVASHQENSLAPP